MMWSMGTRYLLVSCLLTIRIHPILARHNAQWWRRNSLVPPLETVPALGVQPNNPDFPNAEVTQSRLAQGWTDAWRMASIVCATFNDQEDVYYRYFGETIEHPALVRSIICNIAGIDDPSTCNVLEIINSKNPVVPNPKMPKLLIYAGFFPAITSVEEQPDISNDYDITATTFQSLATQYGLGSDDDLAITQVYKRAMDYPELIDIATKRGCAGLGAKGFNTPRRLSNADIDFHIDSGLMTSLGSHILHELFHWRYLVRTESNKQDFDTIVPHNVEYEEDGKETVEEHDYIDDYDRDSWVGEEEKEIDPVDGYGPLHAAELVSTEVGDSWRNADNFRWYTVSKFWQFVCRREFEKQDDDTKGDGMVPQGANGQVPFPGEQLPA